MQPKDTSGLSTTLVLGQNPGQSISGPTMLQATSSMTPACLIGLSGPSVPKGSSPVPNILCQLLCPQHVVLRPGPETGAL